MDARRRANVAACDKVADAQRQQTARINVNYTAQSAKNKADVSALKKGEFAHKFTAFGKTYEINDDGGLVK